MALCGEGPTALAERDSNPESHGMWLCRHWATEADHGHTGSDGLEKQ